MKMSVSHHVRALDWKYSSCIKIAGKVDPLRSIAFSSAVALLLPMCACLLCFTVNHKAVDCDQITTLFLGEMTLRSTQIVVEPPRFGFVAVGLLSVSLAATAASFLALPDVCANSCIILPVSTLQFL